MPFNISGVPSSALEKLFRDPALLPLLKTIPVKKPPPGTLSNFENPESNGHYVTIIASIFLVIESVFFIAKIYARGFLVRKWLWDDCMYTVCLCRIEAVRICFMCTNAD